MSYRRQFSKTISIPVSISISDPSASGENVSRSGGSVSINVNGTSRRYSIGSNGGGHSDSISHSETIDVNIEVDTNPFDSSIHSANNNVDLLTTAVGAVSTAQVASIHESSRKVAKTIITGFFKNIQADISSQMLELKQKVEARLIHLQEQAQTLMDKEKQMQNDYLRTKTRYTKIFEDLNKELENRVKALDEPVFATVEHITGETHRMLSSDFTETASVAAAENTVLNNRIGVALAKKRANEAIRQAVDFLQIQKQTDLAIRKSTISSVKGSDASYYLPVCFFEANDKDGVLRDCTYDKAHLPASVEKQIDDRVFFNKEAQTEMSESDRENVERYFKANVQSVYQDSTSEHDIRVMNTINKLFAV